MRPPKYQCSMYCENYSDCTKTECDREPMFVNGGAWKMVESSIHQWWRNKEKLRLYNEPRNCKLNN